MGFGSCGVASGGDRFGGPFGRFFRGLGEAVVEKDGVVVVDQVVVVVEVVVWEAEQRAVGDGGGPWVAGAGVGCLVL